MVLGCRPPPGQPRAIINRPVATASGSPRSAAPHSASRRPSARRPSTSPGSALEGGPRSTFRVAANCAVSAVEAETTATATDEAAMATAGTSAERGGQGRPLKYGAASGTSPFPCDMDAKQLLSFSPAGKSSAPRPGQRGRRTTRRGVPSGRKPLACGSCCPCCQTPRPLITNNGFCTLRGLHDYADRGPDSRV